MVAQGPKLVHSTLALFPDDRAAHIRAVSAECAKTITGYISGNLLISVICGGLTYAVTLDDGRHEDWQRLTGIRRRASAVT